MAQLTEFVKEEQKGQSYQKPVEKEVKQTALDMEAEIKSLEIQAKKLELLEREANLQDVKERLAERELKRENARQKSIINGQTLKQLAANDKAVQARCTHHKGGDGAQGVVGGQGNDPQYCVLKHKMSNGDLWIRCLRCGKTWKPPVKRSYKTAEAYQAAMEVYEAAKNFMTRNGTSGGVLFQYSDGGEFFREVTENVSLR